MKKKTKLFKSIFSLLMAFMFILEVFSPIATMQADARNYKIAAYTLQPSNKKAARKKNTFTVPAGLKIKIKYPNISAKKIKWSSENTSIATIDKNGYVKGITSGKVTCCATIKKTKKKIKFTIKVVNNQYYSKNFSPLYQDYSSDELFFTPRKVYYSNGKLYVNTYLYNRTSSQTMLSGGVLITVRNNGANTNVIAEQSFNNLENLEKYIDAYDYITHTFKIKSSRVKIKDANLTNLTAADFTFMTY